MKPSLPVIGRDHLWFTENKEQVIQRERWIRQPINFLQKLYFGLNPPF